MRKATGGQDIKVLNRPRLNRVPRPTTGGGMGRGDI